MTCVCVWLPQHVSTIEYAPDVDTVFNSVKKWKRFLTVHHEVLLRAHDQRPVARMVWSARGAGLVLLDHITDTEIYRVRVCSSGLKHEGSARFTKAHQHAVQLFLTAWPGMGNPANTWAVDVFASLRQRSAAHAAAAVLLEAGSMSTLPTDADVCTKLDALCANLSKSGCKEFIRAVLLELGAKDSWAVTTYSSHPAKQLVMYLKQQAHVAAMSLKFSEFQALCFK